MLGIRTFKTLDEAIAEANRLPFGLGGYVFTQSLKNSHKLSQGLQVGMLWINQQAAAWPEYLLVGSMTLGMDLSGYEAIEAYFNTKSVSIFAR